MSIGKLTEQWNKRILLRSMGIEDREKYSYCFNQSTNKNTRLKTEYWFSEWQRMLSPKYTITKKNLFSHRLKFLSVPDTFDIKLLFAEPKDNCKLLQLSAKPRWLALFGELIASWSKLLQQQATISSLRSLAKSKLGDLVYEDFLFLLVLFARRNIKSLLGEAYSLISDKAWLILELDLTKQLYLLSSRSLTTRLHSERLRGNLRGQTPEARYESFANEFLLSSEYLIDFFSEYSALLKLMMLAILNWIQAQQEIVVRFERDFKHFQDALSLSANINRIVDINLGVSDPHNNQKSVKILTLNTGEMVVYKPKQIYLENDFNTLLKWFNEQDERFDFRTVRTLSQKTHGWSEFVPHQTCKSKSEIERYYRRIGQLLCLLYGLQATDCHSENLIANGEYPVFIDIESIFHPGTPQIYDTARDTDSLALAHYFSSVFRTGMLPSWRFYEDDRPGYDVSGIGGSAFLKLPWKVPKWADIKTDTMHIVHEYPQLTPDNNTPRLNGERVQATVYTTSIVQGFEEMYRFLIKRKKDILKNHILRRMFNRTVRYINHNSQFYLDLISSSFNADHLREGVFRDVQLEVMYQSVLFPKEKQLWKIAKAEIDAMRRMDIPTFYILPQSTSLFLESGEVILDYFSQPATNYVQKQINGLSEKDLMEQVGYIRASLYSFNPSQQYSIITNSKSSHLIHKPVNSLDDKTIFSAVEAISEDILDRSIHFPNGLSWIDLEYNILNEQVRVQPLSNNLYNGSVGIACFFAALSKITAKSKHRKTAYQSVESFVGRLNKPDFYLSEEVPVGLLEGIGGVIYSFLLLSRLLNDNAFRKIAFSLAELHLAKNAKQSKYYDIGTGTAGALIAFVTCYEMSAEQKWLNLANLCAQKTVQLWNRKISLYQSGESNPPLIGFAHGSSGVAYALARLANVDNNSDLLEHIKKNHRYETGFFSHEQKAWPDLRNTAQNSFPLSWCNGIVGIGISRLELYQLTKDTIYLQELKLCLNSIINSSLSELDHKCCGNLGKVEFLLISSEQVEGKDTLQKSREIVSQVIHRAGINSSYTLYKGLPKGVYNLGLFSGTAGIGYGLLRLLYPSKIPSVLAFK